MKILRKNPILRIISRLMVYYGIVAFIGISTFLPTQSYAQSVLNLPTPGTMVTLSPSYNPAIVAGITIYPDDPLQFDFIIDVGDDHLQGEALRKESKKLISYFMATLTVPEDEMWVNLSPYEKDRIIADGLGDTIMGRDMLAQDYILKQLTASMMYPEDRLGSEFWKRVYKKAQYKFGTTEIPTDTFNKIWIIPEKAVIYANGTNIFVADSYLKVMLEEDYLALEHHDKGLDVNANDTKLTKEAKVLIKEILLPEIEKEVNQGKNFAPLRQIYHSMILATWYKNNLKESLLGQVYANQNKVNGVDIKDKDIKHKIYNQYVEAFKKGVYNYIKEDYDSTTKQVIPRKYFSGGLGLRELKKAFSNVNNIELDFWLGERRRSSSPMVTVRVEAQLEQSSSPLSPEHWDEDQWDLPSPYHLKLAEKFLDRMRSRMKWDILYYINIFLNWIGIDNNIGFLLGQQFFEFYGSFVRYGEDSKIIRAMYYLSPDLASVIFLSHKAWRHDYWQDVFSALEQSLQENIRARAFKNYINRSNLYYKGQPFAVRFNVGQSIFERKVAISRRKRVKKPRGLNNGRTVGRRIILLDDLLPEIRSLDQLPNDVILAMTVLPSMSSRMITRPPKGIMTYVNDGEGDHAASMVRGEWDIPAARVPGPDFQNIRRLAQKKVPVYYEVKGNKIIIREATNEEISEFGGQDVDLDPVILPQANLEGEDYYIMPGDTRLRDPMEVGYKIAMLYQLADQISRIHDPKIKIEIPQTTVLPFRTFYYLLELGGVKNQFLTLRDRLNEASIHEAEAILIEIEDMINELSGNDGLIKEFWEDLFGNTGLGSLFSEGVFARDSNNAQNLPDYPSFGRGKYLTETNIKYHQGLINSIMRINGHTWSPEAYFSRKVRHIDENTVHPVVGMSKSIDADYSFVIQTSLSNSNFLLIEIVQGLGESLVGASEDSRFTGLPTQIVWDKKRRKIVKGKSRRSTKRFKSVLDQEKGGRKIVRTNKSKEFLKSPDANYVSQFLAEQIGPIAEQQNNGHAQEVEGSLIFDPEADQPWTLIPFQTSPLRKSNKEETVASSPVDNVSSAFININSDASISVPTEYGGIDFNAGNLNLKEQGQALDINFTNLPNIQADIVGGVTPVIINITPIVNFPLLLGESKEQSDEFSLSQLD